MFPASYLPSFLSCVTNPATTILLSVASVWEVQIKLQLGKLTLALPLAEIITDQQQTNGNDLLPVNLAYVLALQSLPTPHKDPFDRLLVVQANAEGAVLLSVAVMEKSERMN